MKVTIDIECTPLEARQFVGLPDVQPMQAAVLAEVERRLMAEAEKFSPEGFMRAWFGDGLQGADWFREALGGFFAKANAAGARVDHANSPKKD
ncbi:MAG: DUF6489 family protein [Roseiarcus sp.]